jgi:hypothetical protein
MSKDYQTRPSEILDIDDPFAAFCLDRAVHDFGSAVESALSDVEGKTKKEIQVKSDRVLRKWLDMPLQYRDPVRSGHVQLPMKGGGTDGV